MPLNPSAGMPSDGREGGRGIQGRGPGALATPRLSAGSQDRRLHNASEPTRSVSAADFDAPCFLCTKGVKGRRDAAVLVSYMLFLSRNPFLPHPPPPLRGRPWLLAPACAPPSPGVVANKVRLSRCRRAFALQQATDHSRVQRCA